MDLKTPVKNAGGIYNRYCRALEKLNIITFEDFLYHIPSRYEDYSIISKIDKIQEGETITIQGIVTDIKNEYTKSYKKIQKAIVKDDTGQIEAVWFNQPFLIKNIKKEDRISLSGRVNRYFNKNIMESPEYEVARNTTNFDANNHELIHTGRLVPVYPQTRGVSSKWIRRQVYKIIQEHKQNLFEYIPDSILKDSDLIGLFQAFEQIHFPETYGNIDRARKRLAFDELFLIQLAARKKRKDWEKNQIEEFWSKLPFELTNAQKKAVKEIYKDIASNKPMNRLLEGDVGSGKTVVSAIAMYLAFLNGFQAVLMAPTEILANQHFKTISDLLTPLGVNVELVTGSKKLKLDQKSKIKDQKESTKFDILIGTHAVLSEKIKFDKLGLVVIDEQQRFGVEQRAVVKKKGNNPHLLV